MPFVKRHSTMIMFVQAACDGACIVAGHAAAAWLTLPPNGTQAISDWFSGHIGYLVVFALVWYGTAIDQGLFASQRGDTLRQQLLAICKAAAITVLLTGFLMVFFSRRGLDRGFLVYAGVCTLALLIAYRSAARLFIWRARRHGYNYRQILIVGGNERARRLVDFMVTQGWHGYKLAGLLDDEPERIRFLADYNVPYLGNLAALERVLLEHVIDEVYVCLPVRGFYETIKSMANLCEGIGMPIRMIADLFPLRIAMRRVRQFGDIPILSLSAVPEMELQLFAKRLFDVAVSALFLATIGSWLFPIVALLIKLDSKGPVFFLQERVGLNQRRFRIIKFRSMVADAERYREQLEAQNEADGPVFKIRRDPRITRVGRWLRKFSIDEMPQFINVFLGDMSLVGPRPPLPAEVAKYTWDQRRRLSVRPGITGLQQISGRSDLNFDEWVELDLAYIDNWSLMVDLRILIRTVEVVVLARGAA